MVYSHSPSRSIVLFPFLPSPIGYSQSLPFTMIYSHSHSRSIVLFPFLPQSHWLFPVPLSSIPVLLVVSHQMTSKLNNARMSTAIAKGLVLVLGLG